MVGHGRLGDLLRSKGVGHGSIGYWYLKRPSQFGYQYRDMCFGESVWSVQQLSLEMRCRCFHVRFNIAAR